MAVNLANIPKELKDRPQWVLWCWEQRVDRTTGEVKWTKPPYQPNGANAESDNPATWVSFEEAKAAYERGDFSGIGYVVTVDKELGDGHPGTVDDVIAGVDLDHVVDVKAGAIIPWAQSIVDRLDSYTDISPSGTGLRIFVYAKLPPKDRKLGGFECYESGRYLTVTGNHLPGTPLTIEARQEELTAIHAEIFAERHKRRAIDCPPPEGRPVDLEDDLLMEVAFGAKNGQAVQWLYRGDTSRYGSHSEADLALCSHLAFYTAGDAARMDRMFRASDLFRPKWDERHGAQTYGEMTIIRALEGVTEFYTGHSGGHRPNGEHGTGADSPERPTISISGRHMREITADALEALKEVNTPHPVLFHRGTSLVRLRIGEAGASAEALAQAALRGILDRAADFVKFTEKGDTPARPPGYVVADILSLPDLPFPGLRGFAETPVFLQGGKILDRSGYDLDSGLYLYLHDSDGVRRDMPLEEARSLLVDELLGDFPFADDGSRAHYLALLFQPFARHMIDGPTPLYLVDAPSRGTGKGLLVDVASVVSLGRPAHVMVLPRDEDELDKRITATLIEGHSIVLLDNVVSLKSTSLSAVLTTTLWRGRRLGKSEMVEVPNATTWIATGNNVAFSDEMVRRTVHTRLDAGVERPEERTGFRHLDLMAWVRSNRTSLVSACLSIAQAWIDAGMPSGTGTLGRFERWVEVMGGILRVAGVEGFMSNREALYSGADAETHGWTLLCQAWWEQYRERPITAKDVLEIAKDNNVVMDIWAGRNALGAQQRFGHALAARRDRVFGDYRIRKAGSDGETKSLAYRLERGGGFKTPETPVTTNSRYEVEPDGRRVFVSHSPKNPVLEEQDPGGATDTRTGVSGVTGVSAGPPAEYEAEEGEV